MQKQIVAAVLTAVIRMPTDLANLIGQYATVCPHRFTISGFEDVGTVRTDVLSKTTDIEMDNRSLHIRQDCWHTFVSDVTLSIGETEWTVDFPARIIGSRGGWIGVGVTATAGNRISQPDEKFGLMTGRMDWLVGVSHKENWNWMNNGKTTEVDPNKFCYAPRTNRRVRFSVEPRTGVITARFSPVSLTSATAQSWSYHFMPDVPFALLRPCVVIAGPVKAVFRSGPPM